MAEDNYKHLHEAACIIFVHGALTDGNMWSPHVSLLNNEYEVLTPTLSHFGEPRDGDFGLNTHAEDLSLLIKEIPQEKKIHLVGWSYGADVVLNSLTKFKPQVLSAFLYEPGYPGCVSGEDMKKWNEDAADMFGPIFQLVNQEKLNDAVRTLMDKSANRDGYFLSQPKLYQEQQLSKAYTLKLQLNQKEQPALDITELSKIFIPVTIAYGSKTRTLFRIVSTSVYESIANSKILRVDGENHMLPLENPRKFVDLLKDHLKQIKH